MDALVLIAVAGWSFLVALVGGVVGLVLGNLRLPLIVSSASAGSSVTCRAESTGTCSPQVVWGRSRAPTWAPTTPAALSERRLLEACAAVLVVSGLAVLAQAIAA